MANPSWTKAQLDAITTHGHDVLVSAAAGSGKTTALTERIVRMIEDGGDVGRLLVVTFSRASAADMKQKLSRALRQRAESTGSRRLLRQCARLGEAQIGTIHSFCYSLVRRYHELLGLPSKLRVPDEAECRLLREECMNDTIDGLYESDSAAAREYDPAINIDALADHIAGSRDDSTMAEVLLSLYDKTSCLPDRHRTISAIAEEVALKSLADSDAGNSEGEGFFESPVGIGIKRRVLDAIDYYIAVMNAACEYLAHDGDFGAKYLPAFDGSRASLSAIRRAVDGGGIAEAADAIDAYSTPRLGVVRGKEKPPLIEFFCEKRREVASYLRRARGEYYSTGGDALRGTVTETLAVCRGITRVLDAFDARFRAEKKRRAVLDYDDLERMARELLSRDEVRAAVAGSYDEIFIDEYQDVNGVQNEIFSAISSGESGNRFMVGDVKQSIYGFRGADPTLFDRYRRELFTVFMSENFRCDETVIDFTNAVCGGLLPFGNVTYEARDALVHAKDGADSGTPEPVRVILSEREREPEIVAELVAGELKRGTRPEEIAILLRSARSRGAEFCDALRARGIGAQNDTLANFFDCPEVLLVLAILHVCDNPLYDIYTAGALRSPVFGFSLDELAALKAGDKRPLFRVLRDGAKCADDDGADGTNGGDGANSANGALDKALADKCRDAYATICRWREITRTMPADEVIRMIYDETGIESLLWGDVNSTGNIETQLSADNLSALYEYARGFESGGFRGLHRFVAYVDGIIESGTNNPVRAAGDGKTVRIMTIHQSKGLEFPAVILAGCGAERNERDTKASVLWSRNAGAAMRLRAGASSTVMRDTLLRRGVAAAITDENISEEMRILYVALTRAKNRLVVTAGVRDPERVVETAKAEAQFFCAHTVRSERTAIGWILTSLYASGYGNFTVDVDAGAKCDTESVDNAACTESAPAPEAEPGISSQLSESRESSESLESRERIDNYREIVRARLSYRYPYERLGALPAKLSVSRLEPGILDGGDEDAAVLPSRSEDKPESARRGTATHIFMQFCDFERAERGVESEVERLVSLGYMTRQDAELVRLDEAEKFFRSSIYGRIKRAPEVWRERRFNVRLPASDFTENEDDRQLYCGDELLVQGVIDCFFRESNGGIVLLDYKTDRLTPYELSHPRAAAEKLASRHRQQLTYYRTALEKIFGAPPTQTYVYSMHLGDAVEIV